jgi:hypothetical protein
MSGPWLDAAACKIPPWHADTKGLPVTRHLLVSAIRFIEIHSSDSDLLASHVSDSEELQLDLAPVVLDVRVDASDHRLIQPWPNIVPARPASQQFQAGWYVRPTLLKSDGMSSR